MKKYGKKVVGAVVGGASVLMAGAASAAITIPTLATTDIESAATAVLTLVGVSVVAGMVIKMLRRA